MVGFSGRGEGRGEIFISLRGSLTLPSMNHMPTFMVEMKKW